jgi:2-polyprenyl-3-methyl-5-hydroxy-6-metoxy-1,4-benzoquinol methylase
MSEQELSELNTRMSKFYSDQDSRKYYQELINAGNKQSKDPVSILTENVVDYILDVNDKKLLEVGCGSGMVYKQLVERGHIFEYQGIEMSQNVIDQNKVLFPDESW